MVTTRAFYLTLGPGVSTFGPFSLYLTTSFSEGIRIKKLPGIFMPGFFLFLFGGYDTVPYICGTKANNMNISEIKVGDKFQAFYGDGTPQGIITITRFTKAFVCVTLTNNRQHTFAEHKEGNTRVADYLKTGAWTPVKN